MKAYIKPILIGFAVAFVTSAGLTLIGSAGGADPGFTPALVGMIFGVSTAYILANLSGNRRGRAADPADKAEAVALRTPPGQGLLIVMREGFVAKAAGLDVTVDARFRVQLKAPRFAAVPMDPGRHTLGLAFGGLAAKQNTPVHEDFAIGQGEVVAYGIKVTLGALKNTIVLTRLAPDPALSAKLEGLTMTAVEPEPIQPV